MINHITHEKLLASSAENIVTTLLLVIFVVLVVRYQYFLLNIVEWGDESETIVISKLLASGKKLYTEVFSQHGPLAFLPGIITEQFGDFKFRGHRTVIAGLQLLALASIYFSPLVERKSIANIYTGLAASVLVLYFSSFYAHMYMYHVLGGIIIVVVLAQYTLPSIATPDRVTAKELILGNFLIGLLPFLAISYLPASVILFFVSLKKASLKKCTLFASGGFLFGLAFLLIISSIAGYLAIHIYLNFFIYSSLPHNDIGSLEAIFYNAMGLITGDLPGFLLFSVIFISLVKLASYEKGFPWRTLLIGLAIASLIFRGGSFLGLPYYFSSLAFPLIFLVGASKLSYKTLLMVSVFSILCFIKLSLVLPQDSRMFRRHQLSEESEFSKLVDRLTTKEDLIISYTFKNYQYLLADRLPASGNIFYLPQQDIYSKNPLFGVNIDTCKEIADYLPKIMLINKWKAWNRYRWEDYGACVQETMDKHYIQVFDKPYYIREDVLNDYMGVDYLEQNAYPTVEDIMAVGQVSN